MSYNERVFCEHNKHLISKVKNKNQNYLLFKFIAWKFSVLLKIDHRNNKSLVTYKIYGKINDTITRVKASAAKSKDSNEPPDGKQLKLFTGFNLLYLGAAAELQQCMYEQAHQPPEYLHTQLQKNPVL